MDTTTLIITTIISLLTIVGLVGKFISNQTSLSVQLANIQKELVEIKLAVKEEKDKRDNEVKDLTERIIKLEERGK